MFRKISAIFVLILAGGCGQNSGGSETQPKAAAVEQAATGAQTKTDSSLDAILGPNESQPAKTPATDGKPDDADARHQKALELSAAGKTIEAISQLYAAIQARPNFPAARHKLSQLLGEVKRYDEAVNVLAEGVKTAPDVADAHHHYAVALLLAGRVNDAVAEFNEALRIQPDHGGAPPG